MKIAIINGPNLNLVGSREKNIYGDQSFDEYLPNLSQTFPDAQIDYFQSNIEGELIDRIQEKGKDHDGIILNAGAYTHTSLALADAVAAVKAPVIEVHLSNIFAREDHRHVSYLGAKCKGSISGFGLKGYEMAILYFLDQA
jgi:3-dehydroquinate dehydratase-2